MANKEEYRLKLVNFFYFLCILATVCIPNTVSLQASIRNSRSVVQFDLNNIQDSLPSVISHSPSLSEENGYRRNLHKRDTTCGEEELTGPKIDKFHTFENETKTAMALAWAGENDGTLIIVTSDSIPLVGSTQSSAVFRSTDYGVNYVNISATLNINEVIKKHNGLQRHPLDPKRVYLVGEAKIMYITDDGGMSFTKINLPFYISGELIFHTSTSCKDYIMAFQGKDLYASVDHGVHWKLVKKGVDKAVWGVLPEEGEPPSDNPDQPETIYYTYGAMTIDDMILQHFIDLSGKKEDYTLAKSDDGGATSKDILMKVVSFERQGKFLYASTARDDKREWRTLMVSTNGGKKFQEAQLPTIDPERFYSVVDIEDNMIFMHVDNPGDTGHGTLYTSANQGVIYSESLTRHLYPNYNVIHDFYKVKSMRGVFITSQMSNDDSIHTMITYNRGANWQMIPRPANAPCKDENKACNLHIHGMYSINRNINAMLPISEASAVGIIMAHGHVADALQRTPPDVFVSSDGGYSWSLSLKGPHHYQIGDNGGFLVAVSKSEPSPQYIKFSTDEGRCWKKYKFTDKVLNFTGLLTEPEGKSSVVMLWGYVSETKKWEVHVIDFKDVISRKCGDSDYEVWLAHSVHRSDEGADVSGCLLGVKETFYRLKKDSYCYNGHEYVVPNTSVKCKCTREDYECDYGFYRPGGTDNCVKEPEFKGPEIDICLHGHDEKLVSEGFRKIPGDKCIGGYLPTTKIIDLNKQCDEFGQSIVKADEGTTPSGKGHENAETVGFSRGIKILAVVVVIAVLILASVMGVYFIRRFVLLKRHKTEYRYSRLSQSEQHQNLIGNDDDEGNLERDLDKALAASTVKYQDSDEELPRNSRLPNKSPQKNGNLKPIPKPVDTNPFGSYHDDSDDDMLS